MFIINHFRKYFKGHTSGRLIIDGNQFCYTLEDQSRPSGVKVDGDTCIPDGVYKVVMTFSERFNRNMLQLYNVEDGMKVERDDISFTGIRPHGGNTILDTRGCPLCAYERNSADEPKIWRRADKRLFDIVAAKLLNKEEVLWVISEEI